MFGRVKATGAAGPPAKTGVRPAGRLRRFRSDEAGAVTVDFLVISATIVVLGTVIVGMTRDGSVKVATEIDTSLSAVPVN